MTLLNLKENLERVVSTALPTLPIPAATELAEKAYLRGVLFANSVKEMGIDNTLIEFCQENNIVLPADVQVYNIEGKLFALYSREETSSPYETYQEDYEDLLSDMGVSEENLPFATFYSYYKRYEKWLEEETLSRDDEDFLAYMAEIESISDITFAPPVSVALEEFEKKTVYDAVFLIDINKTISDLRRHIENQQTLLASLPQKIAEDEEKLNRFSSLAE